MKIWEKLKRAWDWLDGKKSVIALTVQTALVLTHIVNPGLFPGETYGEVQGIVAAWAVLALGDKARKSKIGQDVLYKKNKN